MHFIDKFFVNCFQLFFQILQTPGLWQSNQTGFALNLNTSNTGDVGSFCGC